MNKYRARKSSCNHGHTHDSKREAARCGELHLLLRAGHISAMVVHPTFELAINGVAITMRNGHKAKYTPDFTYQEGDQTVAEDVKGFIVRDFPLRAAVFRHCYPEIELRVTK